MCQFTKQYCNKNTTTRKYCSVAFPGIDDGGSVGEISLKRDRLMLFAFEKTPRISLSCKLGTVQNREYEYALLNTLTPAKLGYLQGLTVLHTSTGHSSN